MNVLRRVRPTARTVWEWLTAPEPPTALTAAFPPARRGPARELLVALAMALLVAGTEELLDSGPLLIAASAAGAFALWLLRRRLPGAVLVVAGGLGALFGGFAIVLSLVAWSAGRRIADAGHALIAFGLSYLLYLGLGLGDLGILSFGSPIALVMLGTLAYVATVAVPGLAARYWSQRRTLLHTLQERNAQLLWEHQMIAGQARLLERQRIAQDMHDSLGHQLALISVHTGALEVDPGLTDRQREAVGVLRNASVAAMHELREVVGILRDGIAAPHSPADGTGPVTRGIAGLDALVADARRAGSEVRLRRAGEERPVAAAVGHAAYRIVQEALTNAFKHAPGAAIDVELRYEPDSLVVEVVSDRAARLPADEVVSGGQGLTGLRERARLVGGIVHAGPADGGGFRVAGVLPYGAAEPGAPAPEGTAPGGFLRVPGTSQVPNTPQTPGAPQAPGQPWPGGPHPGPAPATPPAPRGQFSGFGMGCGFSFALALAVLAAIVVGAVLLVRSADQKLVSRETYESLRVGMSEDAVRDRLPTDDGIFHSGLDSKPGTPARPPGATCLTLSSTESSSDWDTESVFRFCFRDGKLIQKKSFEVKL
ncbi:sensor histidine kinase [Streptomyces sp. JNUCC 64]